MNYNPGWMPPPNYFGGYPPQQPVAFIPVPQTKTEMSETIALLKAIRKEDKKKKEGDKKPPETPKKDGMTYFQQVACWFAISPFIILANALVIGGTFKFLRGVFGT